MARFEILDHEQGQFCGVDAKSDIYFELGLRYATGRDVEQDFISAHKWFNLAVANGNRDAIDHRTELSQMMSTDEIRTAQRAARDHLQLH